MDSNNTWRMVPLGDSDTITGLFNTSNMNWLVPEWPHFNIPSFAIVSFIWESIFLLEIFYQIFQTLWVFVKYCHETSIVIPRVIVLSSQIMGSEQSHQQSNTKCGILVSGYLSITWIIASIFIVSIAIIYHPFFAKEFIPGCVLSQNGTSIGNAFLTQLGLYTIPIDFENKQHLMGFEAHSTAECSRHTKASELLHYQDKHSHFITSELHDETQSRINSISQCIDIADLQKSLKKECPCEEQLQEYMGDSEIDVVLPSFVPSYSTQG